MQKSEQFLTLNSVSVMFRPTMVHVRLLKFWIHTWKKVGWDMKLIFYTAETWHLMERYARGFVLAVFITDRVRSTTGRLCFDTCLSVCPHLGQVQPGGGASVPPPSGLAGGYPDRGTPCWRGTPPQVLPPPPPPPSDLAGGVL